MKHKNHVLLGFDGFTDSLYSVIQSRKSDKDFQLFPNLEKFGNSIASQEGKSINYELLPKTVKMGGNGPLLAYALSKLDIPVCYMGTVGEPIISHIYEPLQNLAKNIYSMGSDGSTCALEFLSGKILLGDHSNIQTINLKKFFKKIPPQTFTQEFLKSKLFGSLNWTMLPFQTDLWNWILQNKTLRQAKEKPTWFIDIADPKKRSLKDFSEVLGTIKNLSMVYPIILGLNLSELSQVFACLVDKNIHSPKEMAEKVYCTLGLSKLVVHNREFAFSFSKTGFFTERVLIAEKPKITTGAGDHFNAGYVSGTLEGRDEATCLKMAISCSGFYVRKGYAPSQKELYDFLNSWQNGMLV